MTHTEAPSSLNFTAHTSTGWRVQITLRDESESNLLERFGLFVEAISERGMSPNGASPTTTVPSTVGDLPPKSPEEVTASDTQSQDTFTAEQLVGSINDGKTYWKVQGGPFVKFGVTIWPEVLADAGFDVDQLDPTQMYSLEGYKATYLKEGNKPKKVTLLQQ